jgi:hypothetical protein
MRESDGIAAEVPGIQCENIDGEKLRLESMMRDGIDPRITGIQLHAITVDNGRAAFVMRIPRSWAMPHMITYKGTSRFFSRNSGGKYQLDVSEIRAAFALSESISERIRRFRMERLAKIVSGETPAILGDGGKVVLHIVPFGAFDPAKQFDIASQYSEMVHLRPTNSTGGTSRFNFDGYLPSNQREKAEMRTFSSSETVPSRPWIRRCWALSTVASLFQASFRAGNPQGPFELSSGVGEVGRPCQNQQGKSAE